MKLLVEKMTHEMAVLKRVKFPTSTTAHSTRACANATKEAAVMMSNQVASAPADPSASAMSLASRADDNAAASASSGIGCPSR